MHIAITILDAQATSAITYSEGIYTQSLTLD